MAVKPRVVEVVAGLDAKFGGPSYSVPRLATSLAPHCASVELASLKGEDQAADSEGCEPRLFDQRYASFPVLSKFRVSPSLLAHLRRAAFSHDVIHAHGLWQFPTKYCASAVAQKGAKARLVVSTRGMLSPVALSYSRLRKQALWAWYQHRVLTEAHCIHATAPSESAEIRALGITRPVAVIPNGIDIPPAARLAPRSASKTILSLGRVHPKKGLDRLIHAFARIAADHPGWALRIVGPSEGGHDHELRQLAASLGCSRISIEEPVYGDEKFQQLRSAEIFILPTLNENFGVSVGEALACGTPAIVTKGAPWAGLETNGCGFWIDHGVEALTSALHLALSLPAVERTAMGERGRAWICEAFSWEAVASEMAAVYSWLNGNGPMPKSVNLV